MSSLDQVYLRIRSCCLLYADVEPSNRCQLAHDIWDIIMEQVFQNKRSSLLTLLKPDGSPINAEFKPLAFAITKLIEDVVELKMRVTVLEKDKPKDV